MVANILTQNRMAFYRDGTSSIKEGHCGRKKNNQRNIFPFFCLTGELEEHLDWFQVCKSGFSQYVMLLTASYNL